MHVHGTGRATNGTGDIRDAGTCQLHREAILRAPRPLFTDCNLNPSFISEHPREALKFLPYMLAHASRDFHLLTFNHNLHSLPSLSGPIQHASIKTSRSGKSLPTT